MTRAGTHARGGMGQKAAGLRAKRLHDEENQAPDAGKRRALQPRGAGTRHGRRKARGRHPVLFLSASPSRRAARGKSGELGGPMCPPAMTMHAIPLAGTTTRVGFHPLRSAWGGCREEGGENGGRPFSSYFRVLKEGGGPGPRPAIDRGIKRTRAFDAGDSRCYRRGLWVGGGHLATRPSAVGGGSANSPLCGRGPFEARSMGEDGGPDADATECAFFFSPPFFSQSPPSARIDLRPAPRERRSIPVVDLAAHRPVFPPCCPLFPFSGGSRRPMLHWVWCV